MQGSRSSRAFGSSVAPPTAAHAATAWTEIVVLAWSFGLAAGVVYAIMQLATQHVLGRLAFVSREVVWMAPLAHLLIFLPLAIVLAIVMRGRAAARVVACGTFAFLATLSLLLPFGALAQWAQIILALGVAVQLTRSYTAHLERARPLLVRSALGASAVVVLVSVSQQLWRVVERRADVAALPSPAHGSPSVLMIILDTVRGENMSLYGYDRQTTPQLVRRASESTVFDRAFSTAPWTLPSHGTLMTGRYPVDLPHDWLRPIAPEVPTIAERFRAHGYLTGGFVANLAYTSYETGLARGFIDYQDYPITLRLILKHAPLALSRAVQQVARSRSLDDLRRLVTRPSIAPGGHAGWHPVRAQSVSDDYLAWEARTGGRPYFAFLNYFNAHDPYRAPDSLLAQFGGGDKPIERYDAAIARLDHEVGRVLDELERRGTLDRTVVVIASDHGELFGEHGLRGHAHALYLPLLHVPLMIRYPAKVPAGARVTTPVSLRDIPATLLDLAGITSATIPGVSLARTWTPADDGAPSTVFAAVIRGKNVSAKFPNARAALWSVIDDDHQLIQNALGEEELYSYRLDPRESLDVVNNPDTGDKRARLRALLVHTTRGR